MATQDKNGKIRGKINNIVYRELGDKQVMQIAPARVKQTYATKLNSMEFGLVSTQAKVLRDVFSGLYEEADGKMAARLTAAVSTCIRTSEKDIGERNLHDADLAPLKGFEFNTDAPFEKLVAVQPSFRVLPNGQFEFSLPRFNVMEDIRYPSGIVRYHPSFLIAITAFHFREEYSRIIDKKVFDFKNIDQQVNIDWSSSRRLPKGAIVIVTFSLRYLSTNWAGRRVQVTDKAFYPTIILEAFHVTDEMVALGKEAGFSIPTSYISEFGNNTNQILKDIARFKEKMTKEKNKS
ncbi:hypothetical protein GCM10007415_18630 [Parapedobacter pyrenivorans]|uniref:Uncharacterized protein n=1 Tax=Parapedobacter pyrenivorans TaxID=1305674 RepID=A0A917HNF0_9SPHI|nr:hypothetical protein [Parapedobacter pyrenivorans]GGG85558.1 hypothetical protein GCM10007415_18630 [Parapedobacter pyrenivorans]